MLQRLVAAMVPPPASPQPPVVVASSARCRLRSVHTQAEPDRHALSVAVVGGGAAGLAAARELLREGHRATVFEKGGELGGVWAYTEQVEDDPLGLGRRHVHGSMYKHLRTNLPREVMGFLDFPFDAAFPGSADPRQFPSHEEVQRYLLSFADRFGLRQHVRLGIEVTRIAPLAAGGGTAAAAGPAQPPLGWLRWSVATRPASSGTGPSSSDDAGSSSSSSSSAGSTSVFDAVVICNGHYSRPRLPQLPGQDVFPGLQMHSHNYRHPEPFRGQTVVLLGASSSGVDIAEEIARAGAKRTFLCARQWENPLTGEVVDISSRVIRGSAAGTRSNGSGGGSGIIKAANLAELHADGSATLADGSCIEDVDVVMYCTGYVYDFPMLEGTGLVSVQDNRVAPLYQHVFPPAAAPTLSFVGLPWKVVPFPQFELQSRWIARVLSGAAALPSQAEMEAAEARFYAELEAGGVPQRYTHRQSGGVQWEYNRWLAAAAGGRALPGWREALYTACGTSRKLNAERYRDAPLPGAAEAEEAARQEAVALRRQSGMVAPV